MGITAAMLLTTIIGGSLAFFQADGKPVQNQLSTKKLDIDLQEDGTRMKEAEGEIVEEHLMPGASVEKHVRVINGDSGDTSFIPGCGSHAAGEREAGDSFPRIIPWIHP